MRSNDRRDRLLRRRRVFRRIIWILSGVVLVSIVLDRNGVFGWQGNDLDRYNARTFAVTDVIDGQTLIVEDRGQSVSVRLHGVDASPDHWAAEARTYLANRTRNRSVILKLEPTRTRTAEDHLQAYVYINDGDLLNVDCVRDGQVYAERRIRHSLRPLFETAEAEARNKEKPRGLWKEVTFDQMPQWRKDWLNSIRASRSR